MRRLLMNGVTGQPRQPLARGQRHDLTQATRWHAMLV
jgi:hypothetical protein